MSIILVGVGMGSFALLSLALLLLLLRSGKPKHGNLTEREVRFGRKVTRERYDPDLLQMSVNVEMRPDQDTLTINAEGPPQEVQRVTDMFNGLLAANTAKVSGAPVAPDDDSHLLRSTFTVVRHSQPGLPPAVEAEVEFTVVDEPSPLFRPEPR